MNPRGTLLLAVVAALLGGFIYFYEIGGEAGRKTADQADLLVFPGLESNAIDAIRLETQDGIRASFVLGEAGWELIEPVRGPAEPTAIDAMTSVLAGLSREGRVESPGDFEQYGLGETARTIGFDVEGESLGLRVGRATPVGGHLYVAPLGSDQVDYVETFRLNAFNRKLFDLRDRRVLPFEPGEATRIELTWPGSRVELARGDGEWRMAFPVEERADSLTVDDFLNDLSYLRAEAFVDELDESVTSGLGEVALEIHLTLDGGRKEDLTIGGVFDNGRLVATGSGRVFTIAPERFEDFDRSVAAYRFKTLSEFDITEATKWTLRFVPEPLEGSASGDDTHVVARLEEAGWTSEGSELDSERVAEAIRALAHLRALTVVAEEMGAPELASLGLSPPRVRIRVDSNDEGKGAPLAEVLLGRLDEQRGLYAQRADDPKVYLLDAAIADSLPISHASFATGFLTDREAPSTTVETPVEAEWTELGEDDGVEPVYP